MTTPRHQVEAAIARLEEFAHQAKVDSKEHRPGSYEAGFFSGIGLTSRELLTILRAECAEILRGDET